MGVQNHEKNKKLESRIELTVVSGVLTHTSRIGQIILKTFYSGLVFPISVICVDFDINLPE